MFGGRSVQLARVFGIRVGADASWFVVLFLLIFILSQQFKSLFPGHGTKSFVLAAITAGAFLLSIFLHELGHAVAALARRMRVLRIDLFAFGGFTTLDRPNAPTPASELLIAAAGPLVTLAIAAGAFVAGSVAVGLTPFWNALVYGDPGISEVSSVLLYLAFINAAIFVVNLVPGLPLDGGRIARAIAWWRTGDLASATTVTAKIGRVAGYAVGAGGIVLLAGGRFTFGIWLIFIAMLITSTARQIETQSKVTERIRGVTVEDVMDREPVVLPATTKLDRALDDYFVRYGWDWFPVADVTGRFLGLASRDRLEAVPEALRPGSSVDQVTAMETRARFSVGVEEPLEALLGSQGLATLGALMAVDSTGVLRGVITVEQVKRALQGPPPVGAAPVG
jgi:Zn-dependent protease